MTKPDIPPIEHICGGQIGFVLHNVNSGAMMAHRPDEAVPSASIIKLPMVLHTALLVHEGKLGWDEPLTLRDSDKVPGYGILRDLTAGLAVSIRDLCQLAIVLSDNTATNMLIERLGIAAINQRIAALGLAHTRLNRKVFGPNTPDMLPYGFGVTTPRDMANLLLMLLRQDVIPTPAAQTVLAMLAAQRDRFGIPRYLPADWAYAGKTGSDDDLRNDIAIVTALGQCWVLAAFCHHLPPLPATADHAGWLALARLAVTLLK